MALKAVLSFVPAVLTHYSPMSVAQAVTYTSLKERAHCACRQEQSKLKGSVTSGGSEGSAACVACSADPFQL